MPKHSNPSPAIIYGTAWKEEKTEVLVKTALSLGFRGVDTANQRKHYFEALVGEAIAASGLAREELFLQTKFTPLAGQDQRLPYDPEASPEQQVRQSFESSLEHLKTDYLDSYVLHAPTSFPDLGDQDLRIWRAMETLVEEGRARQIGISNVTALHLQSLLTRARIQPAVVQNRCLAAQQWDASVRSLCQEAEIEYQGFWLLTGNRDVVSSPAVSRIAERHGKTAPQIIYRFAQGLGITPLSGTTNRQHMQEALEAAEIELGEEERREITALG